MFLRTNEIKTVVPNDGYCFSACVIALTGSVERVVYPGSWVGVHQMSLHGAYSRSEKQGFENGQSSVAMIMDFLDEMGVDPIVWRWAVSTPPEAMRYLSGRELKEIGLATVYSDNIVLR